MGGGVHSGLIGVTAGLVLEVVGRLGGVEVSAGVKEQLKEQFVPDTRDKIKRRKTCRGYGGDGVTVAKLLICKPAVFLAK